MHCSCHIGYYNLWLFLWMNSVLQIWYISQTLNVVLNWWEASCQKECVVLFLTLIGYNGYLAVPLSETLNELLWVWCLMLYLAACLSKSSAMSAFCQEEIMSIMSVVLGEVFKGLVRSCSLLHAMPKKPLQWMRWVLIMYIAPHFVAKQINQLFQFFYIYRIGSCWYCVSWSGIWVRWLR